MVLSAYLIGKDLIQEAKVQSLNDSKLLDENKRLIREKKIKEGEPLTIEKPNLSLQAMTALDLLKKFTYAPKKAYSYLFNIDNGVSDFITYHEDFNKLVRGLTNISAEDFITEFKYFQDVEMKKPAFKSRTRFGRTSERIRYEVERQKKIEELKEAQREQIYAGEDLGRLKLKEEESENFKKLNKAKYDAGRNIQKKANKAFQKAEAEQRVDIQQEEYNNYSKLISIRDKIQKSTNEDEINKLLDEADKIAKVQGSGIKPRKVKKITLKKPTKKVVYPYGQWFAYR